MEANRMLEPSEQSRNWTRSPILKSVLVGSLIFLLLVPLAMVRNLIDERQGARTDALQEVSEKWGASQCLGGPVLIVPYLVRTIDTRGQALVTRQYATLLPRNLEIEGELTPEIRYRGIFEIPLYAAHLDFRGAFSLDGLSELKIPEADLRWTEAVVSVSVPDPRGIRQTVRLQWGDTELDFEPGAGTGSVFARGIHARVGKLVGPTAIGTGTGNGTPSPSQTTPFRFELAVNGSGQLAFLPVGQDTHVRVTSPWPDPSFTGAFLPDNRTVTEDGFTADWRLFYLGRTYPQQWRTGEVSAEALIPSAAGVDLRVPVDGYQKSTRSAKYGLLFLTMTFGIYFLFEMLGRLRIHPFQYLFIGFALVLFYALLVSLSEHLGFDPAYAIAAAATVGLIVAYSASVLGSAGRVVGIGGLLAGLYLYLYVLLQLEDYALLLGAVGLFVTLATVMWVTRRVDWYAIHE
jgi:inner membrane protein